MTVVAVSDGQPVTSVVLASEAPAGAIREAVGIHRDGLIGIESKILRVLPRWGRRRVSRAYRSEQDGKNRGGKFFHGKGFRNGALVVL